MSEKASARAKRIGQSIATFKKIVIDYPPMTAAIEAIEQLRASTRDRDPGDPCAPILLNAPIGTGKTMTLKLAAAHASASAPEGQTPILVVPMPTVGTVDSVPSAILKALGHPRPDLGKTETRWLRATDDMRRCGVEVLALDEFNRAGRRPTMSRPIATSIREHILDPGEAAVAFVGTAEAAVVLSQCDDILDRLEDEIDLSPLEWDGGYDQELFVQFVRDVDDAIVARALLPGLSGLGEPAVARKLCEASQGRLRPLMSIVRGAMVLAIRGGGTSITLDDLREAAEAYKMRVSFLDRNPFS